MEKLYTISEVADKLGLSSKTLRRWEETGKFVGNRTLGGQRRYSLTDLQILDAIKHGIINNSSDLLTVDQAAALCGVTPSTILRWEDMGKIHPLITAGVTYYPRQRLVAKIDELRPTIQYQTSEPILEQPTYAPPTPPQPPITQPHRPLRPLSAYIQPSTSTVASTKAILLNIVTTITLLVVYHVVFNNSKSALNSPTPTQGEVQGVELSRDPALVALDSILDSAGNIKSRSLTTSSISLAPTSTPTAFPGSLYFDAGSQSLNIYRNGEWTEIGSDQTLTGTAQIEKGQDQASVNDVAIKASSIVTVTFNGDYSPARRYWVTVGDGSFTVHTDTSVNQDNEFAYLITND